MNTYKEFLNQANARKEEALDKAIELLKRVLSDEDRMTVLGDIKFFLEKANNDR